MMIYPGGDERAIRTQRMIKDWAESRLITPEQRDRMIGDVQVDYRRTNLFLRATMFVFGFGILMAAVFLVADSIRAGSTGMSVLALIAAGGAFFGAQAVIAKWRLYRFGIEEALASGSIVLFAWGATMFLDGNYSSFRLFLGIAGAAFIVFRRFGFLYAGVAAVLFAGMTPFNLTFTSGLIADTPRRMAAIIVLLVIFGLARERRKDFDTEFPGDLYGVMEATAWAAIYVLTNLKISAWLSVPDDGVPVVYWTTYLFTWILPAVGLRLAIGDRHRWLLDASIVMAIVTVMTNKSYLGGVRQPWDPILFGLMMIAVALVLKRWLSSGAGGSRNGFIAERLLASEQKRLAIAGGGAALGPGAPQPHTHEPPPAFGGGHSGGAGAAGKF
jgi:hypothetical protein